MAILPVFITTEHKSNRVFFESGYYLEYLHTGYDTSGSHGHKPLWRIGFESGMFVHSLLAEVFMRKVLLTYFPDEDTGLQCQGRCPMD